MKIEVNEQFRKFWITFGNGYRPFYGHEIKVNNYRFCVGGKDNAILVSELTTGFKVFSIPMNPLIYLETSTREDTLVFYLERIVPTLVKILENQEAKFKSQLQCVKEKNKKLFGEMPPIEDADDSIITG